MLIRSSVVRRRRRTLMPKLMARSSPSLRAVSAHALRSDRGITSARATSRMATLLQEARSMLPMVQNTSPCRVSSLAMNCSIETRALKVKTSAMPNRMTPEVATWVQRVMPSSSRAASRAKIKALAEINHWPGIPGRPIPSTIASAAPNAAAEETPRVNGLASGLLRMVCISAPASPSARPTIIAITA